jgi:Predicted nucleotide-binding protein containing TIR-like domain
MTTPNKVFVVHGRDKKARDSLFDFLKAIGITPIEWGEAVSLAKAPTPYTMSAVEAAFAHARAVVVLFTGDDEARLRESLWNGNEKSVERDFMPQVRQNVAFEAGAAFATHAERTVVCQIGEVKPFSDMDGLNLAKLDNSLKSRQDLADRLRKAQCEVDLSGREWKTVGDFSGRSKNTLTRKRSIRIVRQVGKRVTLLATVLCLGIALGWLGQLYLIWLATRAADNGDLPRLRTAIALGAPIDGQDLHGATALWYATSKCDTKIVDWLLTNDANPNVHYSCRGRNRDARGWTPLTLTEDADRREQEGCKIIRDRLKRVNAGGRWSFCSSAQ